MLCQGRSVSHPHSLTHVSLYSSGGLAYVVHAFYLIFYAYALQWCYETSGDPYNDAINKYKEAHWTNWGLEDQEEQEIDLDELGEIPSMYMPDFWACFTLASIFFAHLLFFFCCKWIIDLRSIMQYRPATQVQAGGFVKVRPPKHQGKAEMTKIQKSEITGCLYFEFQRQRYEFCESAEQVMEGIEYEELVDRDHEIGVQHVQSPCDLPIEEYVTLAEGLICGEDIDLAQDVFGDNKFNIPIPTFWDLFSSQLVSPIAVFQLFACVLWMLDSYWKYTMFTLFMIVTFEAGTAFSRLKSLNTLTAMGNKPFNVKVFRVGRWIEVLSTELLPGDLVSLKRQSGEEDQNGTIIPCDCLILRGSAVVNESTLTGESIPQLKEALRTEMPDELQRNLDMQGQDKVHVLYSGTLLMQNSATNTSSSKDGKDSDPDEEKLSNKEKNKKDYVKNQDDINADDVRDVGWLAAGVATPDDGVLCYVLRTGFSSSQGKLMRMIECSQQRVQGNHKETALLLLLLSCFALTASGYVLKRGLEEGKRTKYQILLRCVQIITSVVPPELPMQAGLAVNTALMALMKSQVFCTEPFRVPLAGRLTHCLFDKTGTLTSDQLEAVGVISVHPPASKTKSKSATSTATASGNYNNNNNKNKNAKDLLPIGQSSMEVACVIAGCHALLKVDGKMVGDPIESAALKGIRWDYDPVTSTASPKPPKSKALTEAKKDERKKNKDDKNNKDESNKQKHIPSKQPAIKLVHRFRFSSALQRMSTIVRVTRVRPASSSSSPEAKTGPRVHDGVWSMVKGSPEAIGKLLAETPSWYKDTYVSLAEKGHRVLAFAYRKIIGKDVGLSHNDEYEIAQLAVQKGRDFAESQLHFAGFVAFACRTRQDSGPAIRSLQESSHVCTMVTGDAPLTALYVAAEVSITSGDTDKALMLTHDLDAKGPDSVVWVNAIASAPKQRIVWKADEMPKLAQNFELITTGPAFNAAVAQDEKIWDYVEHILVYARMSPNDKQLIIKALKDQGHFTLMCGDGGNDVGALKQAHVGIALLSGFGNVNTGKADDHDSESDGGDKKKKEFKSAEDELSAIEKEQKEKMKAAAKRKKELNKGKPGTGLTKSDLAELQKEWLAEEMEIRAKRGETGFMANMSAMKSVMSRVQEHVRKTKAERAADIKKKGGHVAAHASQMSSLMDGMEDGELPMVKLGDASIAAPFTSKMPSIRSCVDVIRQGRCTLVSTVQQQQILMLNCMITAYSLSALSLEGSRMSEAQLIATNLMLTIASFAFSFAKPLDRLSKVLPIPSVFHPALFVSVLGQMVCHLACMITAVSMAKSVMGEEGLDELIKFNKEAEKKYWEAVEADPEAEVADFHKPNLLNTVVFLVETAQQVSVMGVNYKGRPWTKAMSENSALLWSLFITCVMLIVCAWELIPQLNNYLGLVPLPEENGFRSTILLLLFCSTVGTLIWDRLCLFIFARPMFKASFSEGIRWSSILGSLKKIGMVVGGLAVLGFVDIGIGQLALLYFGYQWYKKRNKAAEEGTAA